MSTPGLAALGTLEPDEDTSPWMRQLLEDPGHEVMPGVFARDLHELHHRRPTPEGAVYLEDVVYGSGGGRPLTMRLYARARPDERRPAIVLVHGGGWTSGDPSMHMRQATGLAGLGFVTALVSYRLYPEARWPDPLADVARAVRWVRANAAKIGADPGRIVLAGASAGGHLSALAALAPASDDAGVSSAVQGLVLWYPVTDVPRIALPEEQMRIVERFFGGPLADAPGSASPIRAVGDATPPPTLIVTGSADATVELVDVLAFHDALLRAGGRVELEVLPGEGHAFDLLPRGWQRSFDRLAAFLTDEFADSALPASRAQVAGHGSLQDARVDAAHRHR